MNIYICQNQLAMELRETVVLRIDELAQYIDRPESVRIQFDIIDKSYPIDVGSMAYEHRNREIKRAGNDEAILVCVSSLRPERKKLLTQLFDYLMRSKGSVRNKHSFLTESRKIINWFDDNNHSGVFSSPELFMAAYIDLTNEIFEKISSSKLTPITGRNNQRQALLLAEIMFDKHTAKQIEASASIVKFNKEIRNAPEQGLVERNLETFKYIAYRFGESVLELKPYPWLLIFPEYQTHIFPSNFGIRTPLNIKDTQTAGALYNYDMGRLLSFDEAREKIAKEIPSTRIRFGLKNAEKCIINNNELGLNSHFRLNDATLAMTAYIQLVIIYTGMYVGELQQVRFDNSLGGKRDILTSALKAIKNRAKGRTVQYFLAHDGKNILKDYLVLREFVLGKRNQKCEYLFFSFNRYGVPTQISDSRHFQTISNRIKGVFISSDEVIVRTRGIRTHKSSVLHKARVAPNVVADALNHSQKTNLDHYSPSSPDDMKSQLNAHWAAVGQAAKDFKMAAENITIIQELEPKYKSIAMGSCDSFGQPEKSEINIPIEPDCRKQFGCMFCSKYLVHADRIDIHKIFSAKYVITQVLLMCEEVDTAEKILREIIIRIDYLTERLKHLSNDIETLVVKIETDVFKYYELTPFWADRLRRYEIMGVIV